MPPVFAYLYLARENSSGEAIGAAEEQTLPVLHGVRPHIPVGRVRVPELHAAVRTDPGEHDVRVGHAAVRRQAEAEPAAARSDGQPEVDVRVGEVPLEVDVGVQDSRVGEYGVCIPCLAVGK